jgi:endonuclease/exonuclease/phosphatase (EEP) superfamily protein YafD
VTPSWARRLPAAIGWTLASVLVAVALVRLWRPSSVPILIGVQGVAGWALLPAYPLAVIALVRRRRALGGIASVLSALQLVLVLTSVGWNGSHPLPAGDIPVRIVSANVLLDNPDIRQLGDDLAAEGADVVVVQEVTDEVLAELQRSALWADYPYRATAPQPRFQGAATFSKLPITHSETIQVAGHPMLLTDLQTAAGPLRLVNVHTVAPLTGPDARDWADQFSALAELVRETPSPTVLAGDFNATLDHAPLAALASGDLRDAFTVAGSGVGATWPRWDGLVPPLMRLDHVLVSAGIDVASVTERTSRGSDHRRLVAEVGLRPVG